MAGIAVGGAGVALGALVGSGAAVAALVDSAATAGTRDAAGVGGAAVRGCGSTAPIRVAPQQLSTNAPTTTAILPQRPRCQVRMMPRQIAARMGWSRSIHPQCGRVQIPSTGTHICSLWPRRAKTHGALISPSNVLVLARGWGAKVDQILHEGHHTARVMRAYAECRNTMRQIKAHARMTLRTQKPAWRVEDSN